MALELNAQPQCLDLRDVSVIRAKELGVKIAINSDAHSPDQLKFMRLGIDQARRCYLGKVNVVNILPWSEFEKWLRRRMWDQGTKEIKRYCGLKSNWTDCLPRISNLKAEQTMRYEFV